MYAAPFLISTVSTMSLLPGLARHVPARTFVSPLLFDEESLAGNGRAPGRRVGCDACSGWMLQRDHALCQCEVADYAHPRPVLAMLRAPPRADGTASALLSAVEMMGRGSAALATLGGGRVTGPAQICARCTAIHCAVYRPLACEISAPDAAAAAAGDPPRAAPASSSCAGAHARLMTKPECQAAARRRGYGRKWLGTSDDAREAPGCVMWEEGNVEFNTVVPPAGLPPPRCSVQGTCLCTPLAPAGGGRGAPAEVQVMGDP